MSSTFKEYLKEQNLTESYSVYKPDSASAGRAVSNTCTVKAFKTKDAMFEFLGKQTSNVWKQTEVEGLKSGKHRMDMVRGKDGKPARSFLKV